LLESKLLSPYAQEEVPDRLPAAAPQLGISERLASRTARQQIVICGSRTVELGPVNQAGPGDLTEDPGRKHRVLSVAIRLSSAKAAP
jgi:hypothetical protein